VFGLLLLGTLLFAQVNLPEHEFVSGNWVLSGERLYQNDAAARLAKVNIQIPQEGLMTYEFDAQYEGGAEDGHGGFGVHLFVDKPYSAASWGAGVSYLVWLNYDEDPADEDIPAGLSAQLYRSYSNSRMELVQSLDLNNMNLLLTEENLAKPITFRIEANGETGEIRLYIPTINNVAYVQLMAKDNLPLKGDWLALRTNGMKLSFTY
jgi:hypothetical protein